VPPVPAAAARRIVTEDLGADIDDVFKEFDDVPLSAASIAQVHACVLRDGRAAVLKIQRRPITQRMNRDLRIVVSIAPSHQPHQAREARQPGGGRRGSAQVTNEELNFALEAYRQSQFRTNISAFGDNEGSPRPRSTGSCAGRG